MTAQVLPMTPARLTAARSERDQEAAVQVMFVQGVADIVRRRYRDGEIDRPGLEAIVRAWRAEGALLESLR